MGWIVAIIVGILMFIVHPFDSNADFYHHINFGKWIVEHRSLMQTDVFTHTAFGLPVIDHSWASGIVLYLVFVNFGATGVRILATALAALISKLLFIWLIKLGSSKNMAAISVFLTGSVLAIRWPDRPELFSYVFLLLCLLVERFAQKYNKAPLLWPIIIWFWGIFYGVGLLFGWGILSFLVLKNYKKIKWYLIGFLISIPTGFLNGYGTKTIFYFFKYIPEVSVYEAEWAGIFKLIKNLPANQLQFYKFQFLEYAIWLILIICILIWNITKKKQKSLELILGSFFIFIPFFAFRQVVNAAILSAPILGLFQGNKKIKISLVLLGLIMWSLLLFSEPSKIDSSIDTNFFRMSAFLKENDISGKTFNHIHLGGKITYYMFPKILVFYDTRDDLFLQNHTWNDLYQIFYSGESVVPLLDKYKVDLVIADLETDQLNYQQLFSGSEWGVVYFNDRYIVALPKKIIADKHLSEVPVDIYLPGGFRPGREKEGLDYFKKIYDLNPGVINQFYLANALQYINR